MGAEIGALVIAGFTAATDIAVPSTVLGVSTAGIVGSTTLLAGSIGLQFALGQKAPAKTGANGQLSIRQSTPVRQGGYGRARLSGYYMLYEVDGPGIISTDVIALASGRICGFKTFFLNDDAVILSGQTVLAMPDGRYPGSLVTLDWRIGLDREVVYAHPLTALPASWDASHRGDAIASVNQVAQQSPDVNHQPTYYPNGLPNPSAVCDLYAVWDPRDLTQDPDDPLTWIAYGPYSAAATYAVGESVVLPALSTGTAAYSGATTYAKWARVSSGGVDYFSRIDGNVGHVPGAGSLAYWLPIGAVYRSRVGGNVGNMPDASPDKWVAVGQNPVLQTIDYLTNEDYGLGLDRETLVAPVLSALMAKADLCDALVADKTSAMGPRYTSNGRFNFDDDPADVLGAIAATCDMWWTEDGAGALALEVGVYNAPTVTFGLAHVVAFSVNYGTPDEQAVNELTITFTDPSATGKYKDDISGDPWRNEDDITLRGKIRSQSLALPWVQRHSQARRLAKRAAARLAAPQGTMTLTLYGLLGLGQRWIRLQYPFLPGLEDCVVEISKGTMDFAAGTVAFDWLLIDPATIDAWDPVTEEGAGPGEVSEFFVMVDDDLGNALVDDAGQLITEDK